MMPVFRTALLVVLPGFVAAAVPAAGQPAIPVLYPKENSIVSNRVNVVLDPATDWSTMPFFQVLVGKKEYPLVDTSTARHAVQGVILEPGMNLVTIKAFAQPDPKNNKDLKLVATRQIPVFSKEVLFTGRDIPEGYDRQYFHIREQEAGCSGCHRMEPQPQDLKPSKPGDMLCHQCHGGVPEGQYIHGPAAVWRCLSCHNQELQPVRYRFKVADPWKVAKTFQSVEPAVFTIPSAKLFKPGTATLIVAKDKAKELFQEALTAFRQNPGDRLRVEVHVDNTPFKSKTFKSRQALTNARARALTALLGKLGVPQERMTGVGMADKLPKAPNTTAEGRELNNRVEVVVHPAEVKVKDSLNLPVLADRERVVVHMVYARGFALKNLRVIDSLPRGWQYVNGSGLFRGTAKAPKLTGDELVWELGDLGADFQEKLSYVVRRVSGAEKPSTAVAFTYVYQSKDLSRVFDVKSAAQRGLTIQEVCENCHPGVLAGQYKHGPTDAGYCILCHDPHASPNPAWLRKPSWDLCVTCHAEKASGRHVIAGFVSSETHPTKDRRDPMRPGKRLTCTSCHQPHSAPSASLYSYDAKTRSELCGLCHRR